MVTSRVRFGAMSVCVCSVVLWSLLPGTLNGQASQPPQRISITIAQVKPDALDAHIALVKNEGIPAEKKAGVPWRITYRPVFGEPYTFVTVRPVANFAQYDQPPALTRALGAEGAQKFLAKVRAGIVSQRVLIQTMQPQLSINSGNTALENLLVVSEYTLLPGKGSAFNDMAASMVLPALKKNGVKDFWLYQTTFGGPQTRTVVRPIASFADLDRGVTVTAELTRAEGADAAAKLNEHAGSIIESIEVTVLRLVPEMSYAMEKPPAK